MPNIGTLTDMNRHAPLDLLLRQRRHARGVEADPGALRQSRLMYATLGDIRDQMSGCMKRRGHHPTSATSASSASTSHGEEWYHITLGGSAHASRLLRRSHRSLSAEDQVRATIEEIVEAYRTLRPRASASIDTFSRPAWALCALQESGYATHSSGGVRWSRDDWIHLGEDPPSGAALIVRSRSCARTLGSWWQWSGRLGVSHHHPIDRVEEIAEGLPRLTWCGGSFRIKKKKKPQAGPRLLAGALLREPLRVQAASCAPWAPACAGPLFAARAAAALMPWSCPR